MGCVKFFGGCSRKLLLRIIVRNMQMKYLTILLTMEAAHWSLGLYFSPSKYMGTFQAILTLRLEHHGFLDLILCRILPFHISQEILQSFGEDGTFRCRHSLETTYTFHWVVVEVEHG